MILFCDLWLKLAITKLRKKQKVKDDVQNLIGKARLASFFHTSAACFQWHELYNIQKKIDALMSIDMAEFCASLIILHANKAF